MISEADLPVVSEKYTIVDNWSYDKNSTSLQVYYAFANCDTPISLVIKELDGKRALIYEKLCNQWHPNVANTYEILPLENSFVNWQGMDTKVTLAVTECVFGQTLSEYVRENGPLDTDMALNFALQICQGLGFIHSLGMIHKDIKPDNIIVSSTLKNEDGYPIVKIIDFGISENYDVNKIYPTEVGGSMGFRAPEANDYVATKRSDVFSTGCVLNFMLCGKEPSLLEYKGNSCVEDILRKATELDPYHRYADMDAFAYAIKHAMKKNLSDKIPLLRYIPGFRTMTWWKIIVMVFYYATAVDAIVMEWYWKNYSTCRRYAFWLIVMPVVFVFDLFGIYKRIPRRLAKNKTLIIVFRIMLGFIFFFILAIRSS